MVQKKMFKVLSAIEKHTGGTYWLRVGSAFTNKDNSVNIYLDVIPKNFQLQLRELDEEDLRRREAARNTNANANANVDAASMSYAQVARAASAGDGDGGGGTTGALPF